LTRWFKGTLIKRYIDIS